MASKDELQVVWGALPPTPKRMMIVSPSGNTTVRDFSGTMPKQWQRQGVELKPDDPAYSRERTTPMGRAIGNEARYAGAQTLPMAAATLPMMIPGARLPMAAARVGGGFVAGAAADAGQRALSRRPQSLRGSMMAGAGNAVAQTAGEVLPGAVAARANPLAKASLGASLPGMEETLLAAKTPVSNAGMAADQAFIDAQIAAKKTGIATWKGQFSSAQIQRAIKARQNKVKRTDLLSNSAEEALSNALDVLRSKVGGGTKVTQSSFADQFGRPMAPVVTKVPPARLSAKELDEINGYAEDQVTKLYEARANDKDSKPSPIEAGYKELAEATNAMIHTIPDVKKADALMHTRIGLRKAKFDALKRPPGRMATFLPLALGEGVGQTAMQVGHNPWALAAGIPAAGLTYAASSPAGLSKMAFAANDPALQRLLNVGPRALYGAGASYLTPRAERDTTGAR